MPDRENVIKGLDEVWEYMSKNVKDIASRKARMMNMVADACNLLKEQRWIPVTERLPKSMANKVIVYVQHEDYVGYIGYGHYEKYKDIDDWFDLGNPGEKFSDRGYHVTHWMESPMPPIEGR